jgi:predicted methyltransferase MtxX (methanogen marker protein 4)
MAIRISKKTSFNPVNPCDYIHLAKTVPSRVSVAWNSEYAVEAALANTERIKTSQERRAQINELKLEAIEARHRGNLSAQKIKDFREQAKLDARRELDARLAQAGV